MLSELELLKNDKIQKSRANLRDTEKEGERDETNALPKCLNVRSCY